MYFVDFLIDIPLLKRVGFKRWFKFIKERWKYGYSEWEMYDFGQWMIEDIYDKVFAFREANPREELNDMLGIILDGLAPFLEDKISYTKEEYDSFNRSIKMLKNLNMMAF
jgi:hypothetical protein